MNQFDIQIAKFPPVHVSVSPGGKLDLIAKEPLSQPQIECLVKYLFMEGFLVKPEVNEEP